MIRKRAAVEDEGKARPDYDRCHSGGRFMAGAVILVLFSAENNPYECF